MRLRFLIFIVGFGCLPNTLIAQKINPPGTVWLRDNIYIDQAPMLNIHYREYEYMLRTMAYFNLDSIQQMAAAAPYFGYNMNRLFDALQVLPPRRDSADYMISKTATVSWNNWVDFQTYHYSPNFNFYPMVNISYEVAVKFCEWRTAIVQLNYATALSENERQKSHKKIRYRLATKEEWEYAIKKFSELQHCKTVHAKGKEILPAVKPKSDWLVLTNLSEIIQERHLVKGCNWKQTDCSEPLNTTFDSNAPNDWITFRCVCQVED